MTEKEHNELKLRRKQMANFPFCPDHRDKVNDLTCRECEIEHLRGLVRKCHEYIDRRNLGDNAERLKKRLIAALSYNA